MKAKSSCSRSVKAPRFLVALAVLALAVSTTARAGVIVYEGFNYAGQSDNAALSGTAFNGGTGLGGNWTGPGKYNTSGLTFSDLAVAGGCARFSGVSGANAYIAYRPLNVNKTGTIWGSCLFNSVSAVDGSTRLADLIVTKSASGTDYDGNTNFGVAPKRYAGLEGDIRLGGNTNPPSTLSNSGGTAVTQGATYLVLFKVDNVIASGGAASSQTITSWILSAAQYDNFKSGGLTDAELNAASQGSGAANVMQKTTLTATQKASFSVNDFLGLEAYNDIDYKIDEIRFSDASLAEVTPSGTPAADIYSFGPGATIGPVAANAAAISWTVPYGTNVTTLAPTYTLSAGATCNKASGSTQNFTSPVHYIVQASDFATSGKTTDYTVTVAVTPASSAKNILVFGPGATISGTNIAWFVPFGTDVTTLAPTYSVSTFTSADVSFPSGTARNFTTPKTYTITAQDTTTQTYTVTVTVVPNETTLIWNVAGNGAWDTSTANWKGQSSGLASLFYNGKNVIFDNAAGGTITLASGLLPASTTVSATAGTYAFSGSLGGTGSLTKSNGGTLYLDGTNTYTGGTLISAGVVSCALSNTSPLGGAGSVSVTVQSGATLAMNRNQITGSLTLNGGKVATGNGWGDDAWNGPVILAATSTVDVGPTDGSFNMNGVVSGPGGLIKLGTSNKAMPLNGANTFTGPVSVQAGVIQTTSFNRVSGGTATSGMGAPTTVAGGTIALGATNTPGTLTYTGAGETTDRVIKLAGTTGGATLSQLGTGSGLPTTRGASGLLKFTSDVSIPGTAGVDNRKTLTLTQADTSINGSVIGRGEISGSIGDSVLGSSGQLATSVTKAGTGTWTLSGVNTYSGATKVQAGILAFAKSNALGGSSLDISTGAKVQLDYIGTRQISALTYNAGAAQPNGTYGSTSSIATNKDDTRFSGLGTVTVGAITSPSTTTLARTSGTSPSNGGTALTFTATVAGSAPTGSVVFYDGLTALGTVTLNGSAQASLSTSTLTAAVHEMTAWYLGNGSNAPSASAILSQTVVETRPATTTNQALTSGSNPSSFGGSVTFTATVTGTAPTGMVTFYDGTVVLGSSALNGSAQASWSVSNLARGWHPITSRYAGDSNNAPSSVAAALFQTVNPSAGNGKVKVFILAGQSNMVGKGVVETGRDPNNLTQNGFAGGLGSLRNMLNREPNKYGYLADPAHPIAGGSPGWITRSDVWVTYWGESNAENRRGNLDADFGDYGGQGRIGPEYGFGLVAGSQLADQVLIIKYAFGGKSLAADFRPPSSGGTVGPYYTGMLARVNQVLTNLSSYFPAYTGGGYEIVGLGWHQGYNDRINAGYAAEYEVNMTNFIKDVRTALGVPSLPFSIGNTGMAVAATDTGALTVIAAQAAVANPALHPEFAGTVSTVETRPFDHGELQGGSSEGYHWYWNAESYFNIGDSMGKAMMALLPPLSSAKSILTFVFPGQPATTISGTNISVTVPYGTSVTALAPTYTLSALATASSASGATGNFSTPQTYTVTAQDLTTQTYTVTVTVGPSPFSTWASNPAQGLTVGVNNGPLDDPDRDGICNLLEFTLGGAPMVSSQSILPTLTFSGGNWLFEYNRSTLSAPPATTQVVEYGSDLAGWTPVTIPTTSAGSVTITPGNPSDHVSVIIPVVGTKVFVRIRVTQ